MNLPSKGWSSYEGTPEISTQRPLATDKQVLVLDTESFEAEERVIREYLIDVIGQYDGWFARFGQTPFIHGGKIIYNPGKIDETEFVEEERDALDELRRHAGERRVRAPVR